MFSVANRSYVRSRRFSFTDPLGLGTGGNSGLRGGAGVSQACYTLPSSQPGRKLLARGLRVVVWALPSEVGLLAPRGQRVGLVAWPEAKGLLGRSRDVFRTLGERENITYRTQIWSPRTRLATCRVAQHPSASVSHCPG